MITKEIENEIISNITKNDGWLQDEDSRDAMNAVLNALQDLAYRVL